jgi:hypothetical protein
VPDVESDDVVDPGDVARQALLAADTRTNTPLQHVLHFIDFLSPQPPMKIFWPTALRNTSNPVLDFQLPSIRSMWSQRCSPLVTAPGTLARSGLLAQVQPTVLAIAAIFIIVAGRPLSGVDDHHDTAGPVQAVHWVCAFGRVGG